MEGRFDTALLPTFSGKPETDYGVGQPKETGRLLPIILMIRKPLRLPSSSI